MLAVMGAGLAQVVLCWGSRLQSTRTQSYGHGASSWHCPFSCGSRSYVALLAGMLGYSMYIDKETKRTPVHTHKRKGHVINNDMCR